MAELGAGRPCGNPRLRVFYRRVLSLWTVGRNGSGAPSDCVPAMSLSSRYEFEFFLAFFPIREDPCLGLVPKVFSPLRWEKWAVPR